MTQTGNRKLIEVAIPLEAINAASAREKSIRHGHPSTLRLWWARRPLAACRAVLFAQLVDAYQRLLADNAAGDALAWHFHAIGGAGNPLRYSTTWTANDWPEQVLARRILERGWFPNAFRAGGNIERNDLSLWLEQFIPFDFSNRAHADDPGGPGAMWDWRHAPADWSPYHPDHDDYRRAGGMRRAIFRAVDIDSARCRLEADDVARAFARTAAGTTTVLAYSNHDRRDMRPEIARASALIRGVAARYPDVGWRYATATAPEAARVALGRPSPAADLPLDLALRAEGGRLWIESSRPLFGPMPFLAVEETGGLVFRDNPTIEGPTLWCYRPDSAAVLRVGVGAATSDGATAVAVHEITGVNPRRGALFRDECMRPVGARG